MRHRLIIILFVGLIVAVFSTPHNTNAEIKILESDINVEIVPENPRPYSDVTIKLSSYATDINSASIDWIVNNEKVLGGIGRATYSFKTNGPNSPTIIKVNIVPQGGVQISKQVLIQPSEIEMLWQAVNSYTPPFYKGKALPISEGQIRVVAFPNTINVAKADKKNMVYAWNLNDESMQNDSGYGKDSFVFQNSILLNKEKIKLSVSSVDSSYNATGSLEVGVASPKLIFYRKSPINGTLYNTAIDGSTTMYEDEMTIVAEPYFLNRNSGDLQYSWKINNDSIDAPSKETELTIRPSSRGGYATIDLSVESATKLFQSIKNNMRVNL